MGPHDVSAGSEPGGRPTLYVTWITATTVAITCFSSDPVTDRYLRPLFFAALLSFFVVLGHRQPGLRSLPYRLMETGFLLLTVGSLGATVLRHGMPGTVSPALRDNLAFGLDRGIGFLLGFSLLSYGIVLWVPEVIESQRVLRENLEAKRREARAKTRALERATDVIARQEALVSVGELAAGVAHELRNPLAILQSALQRLAAGDLDAGERTRCLVVMERAVTKANRRITGLLDLGRATDFTPRVSSAHDLLKSCVDLAQAQGRIAGVDVECCAGTAGDACFGDPDLLLQVLLNLVRNAIQAGPHAGPIRVRFEAGAGGSTRFVVEDRGHGIETDQLDRLFTPFFTTKSDGTGLGLTVSASLVDKHGGRLWLEPRQGGGTRAVVELPEPGPGAAAPQGSEAHA